MSEEQQFWKRMIEEIQVVITIAEIAEAIGVQDRQVWRWKAGDRPTGLNAINLYLLHMKHCPEGQRPMSHVASE